MCGGSTFFCLMSESPTVLVLMGRRNVRFNLAEGPTYVYTVRKILFFECNFCNMRWVHAVATKVNDKAGHMSNIMLVCNQIKEVTRTLGSTDTHWADFMEYENGTSTIVQLCIREHCEKFLISVFEGKYSFSLGFLVKNY